MYSKGDLISCKHQGTYYRAKCLNKRKATDMPTKNQYFVHYIGWNKRHDEWADENRLSTKSIEELNQANKSGGGRSITLTNQLSLTDIQYSAELKLIISRILKRLMDVNMMILHNTKMIQFSNRNTIHKLIHEYNESISNSRDISFDVGKLFIQRFNTIIHTELIYTAESDNNIFEKAKQFLDSRIQKGELQKYNIHQASFSGILWHFVYGPIHLMRLIEDFPKHLPTYQFPDELVNKHFEYFFKYVEKHFDKYFPE